jgi:MoxR-like ATPase
VTQDPSEERIAHFQRAAATLRDALEAAIVGQHDVLEEITLALFAGGHVLLEGAPGQGKTLMVRTLAEALHLQFSRIQFTPDLMPADIVGTHVVFEDEHGRKRFELSRGPIFGQIVLADEINRATPKTQSALLEAMAEQSVTIAGQRHALEPPFFVLATENPIEMEGTYPLPEAQLDRFLFKVLVPPPDEETLIGILNRTTTTEQPQVPRVMDAGALLDAQHLVREVFVAEPLTRWVARLVRASDPSQPDAVDTARRWIRYGAGVRGAQAMLLTAKTRALTEGRAHVSFEDLRRVAPAALRHRLVPSFEAEADGISPDAIVQRLLDEVPDVPESIAAVAP